MSTSIRRCKWAEGVSADYIRYHDEEWGFPQGDDHRLFEKVCLEGFQAGLSWLTILRKRDSFRAAFEGFDPGVVATFTDADVDRLLGDAGIVRHRGKIEATINNASRALELIDTHQVTNVHLVPTQMKRLLDLPEAVKSSFDGASLDRVLHGAAPCPPARTTTGRRSPTSFTTSCTARTPRCDSEGGERIRWW